MALLERVQGGFIGQTLSSFGITGLYITFVFGIGRFLRFSTQHARMRIPFEDLPTTKRLVALCQACTPLPRLMCCSSNARPPDFKHLRTMPAPKAVHYMRHVTCQQLSQEAGRQGM